MWGRGIRGTILEDRLLTAAGWDMLPGHWNIDQSLPFHYSDALRLITATALLTRTGWAIAICYFWGLTLNLQSIITPDLNYFDYPVLEFAVYWFLHIAAFVVPIMFVWERGYGVAYLATVAWAGIALVANAVTGANYGYLSRGPEGASIIDLLGPWPIYIVWEAVIIAVVWALMTWPFETQAARRTARPERGGTLRRRLRHPAVSVLLLGDLGNRKLLLINWGPNLPNHRSGPNYDAERDNESDDATGRE